MDFLSVGLGRSLLVSVSNIENVLEVLCEQCFSVYLVLCYLTLDMIDSSSVKEQFKTEM